MSQFYVVCEFGLESGRILLGNLHDGKLQISEVRKFSHAPVEEKGSLRWDIVALYREVIEALRTVREYEEPLAGISCVSWPGTYLLFDNEGALIAPTFYATDARLEQGWKKVQQSPDFEKIYQETGTHPSKSSMLFQLAADTHKRLKHAAYALPVADGFNYLLSGIARVEASMASSSQLFDPVKRVWSEPLLHAAGLPSRLLPSVVPAGTLLGPLRDKVAEEVGLDDDTNVFAGCSHQLAAEITGLPLTAGERWAFLCPGKKTLIGAQLSEPVINAGADELDFDNLLGYQGSAVLHKTVNGLGILDACMDYWGERNRGYDPEMLSHLAGSATPFESLFDPADARFSTPEEMPLKIQAYCKDTRQAIPRKPGPVYRCVLESLALMYRKIVKEAEFLAGHEIDRLYVLGGKSNSLLNHFTANALGVPVVVSSHDSGVIGNIVVQALALGHMKSLEEARTVIRDSIKAETITPHATLWDHAYDRFVGLTPALETAAA